MALLIQLQLHAYVPYSPWVCTAGSCSAMEPSPLYVPTPNLGRYAICLDCLAAGKGLAYSIPAGTRYFLPDGRTFEVGHVVRPHIIVLEMHPPAGWDCTSSRAATGLARCPSREPGAVLVGTPATFKPGKAICYACLRAGHAISELTVGLPPEYFDPATFFSLPSPPPARWYRIGHGQVPEPGWAIAEPVGTPVCRCDFSKGLWGVHQAGCAWRAAGGNKLEKIRALEQQIAALRGKP